MFADLLDLRRGSAIGVTLRLEDLPVLQHVFPTYVIISSILQGSVVVEVLLNKLTPHDSRHGGAEITENLINSFVFFVSSCESHVQDMDDHYKFCKEDMLVAAASTYPEAITRIGSKHNTPTTIVQSLWNDCSLRRSLEKE